MISVPTRRIEVRGCPDCGGPTVWDRYVCARCAVDYYRRGGGPGEHERSEPDAYRRALRRLAGDQLAKAA